jgi:hypothetical protein
MFRKLRRIIDWIPTLWKLYDFDYSSIYRVLRKQLQRMEPVIRDGCALSAEDTADQIHFAVLLLDRLIACDYLTNALIPHEIKWGEAGEWIWKDSDNGLSELRGFSYEHADTEEKRLLAEEEFSRCGQHSDWVEERDKNLLFEYIGKHIKRWWD